MTISFNKNFMTAWLIILFTPSFTSNAQSNWANGIGGNDWDEGKTIIIDGNSNSYIIGSFNSNVDFDPSTNTSTLSSAGNNDIFIAKYNSSGNYVWAKSMGGTGDDYGKSIGIDASGNIFIIGYFNGTADFDPSTTSTHNMTSNGLTDVFLAKYDATGNFIWAKSFGGSDGEYVTALAIDSQNNLLLTGSFNGSVDFDPSSNVSSLTPSGNSDLFIAKFDNSGNYLWAKSIGGSRDDESISSIALDQNNNAYVTGWFTGTADFDPSTNTANLIANGDLIHNDIFFAKYDASGNYVWAKSTGGSSHDRGSSIILDPGGKIYITGSFEGTSDFDPSSNTSNLISNGYRDIFIVNYDNLGNYLWAKNFGSGGDDWANAMKMNNGNGNIYLTGSLSGTVDFDASSAQKNLTSDPSAFNLFLFKCNPTGGYLGAVSMGGPNDYECNSVTVDAQDNAYITGRFNGPINFNNSTPILNPVGSYDLFISKLSSSIITSLLENSSSSSLVAYPNPSENQFTIELGEVLNNISVEIYNTSGQILKMKNFDAPSDKITVEIEDKGIYFLKINQSNTYLQTIKVVKK